MELDSLVRVGLAEKLSILEILDMARFWSCDPLPRGCDPFIRGKLINRVTHATPCDGGRFMRGHDP